jgi:hypothetical protein
MQQTGPEGGRSQARPAGRDFASSQGGSPVSIVADSSLLVAATVDAGPGGIWGEQGVENNALTAPQLVLPKPPPIIDEKTNLKA